MSRGTPEARARRDATQQAERKNLHRPQTSARLNDLLDRSKSWLSTAMIAERIGIGRSRACRLLIDMRTAGAVESRRAVGEINDAENANEWRRVRVDPSTTS